MKLQIKSPRAWHFQSQLALVFGATVFVFSMATALIGSWYISDSIQDQLLEQGVKITDGFKRQSKLALLYGLGDNARAAAEATMGFPHVRSVSVYELGGEQLLHIGEAKDWEPDSLMVPDGGIKRYDTSMNWHFVEPVYDFDEVDLQASPFEKNSTEEKVIGYVHIVLSKDGLKDAQRSIFTDTIIGAFVSAILILIVLQWLTARITRPVNDLAQLMERAEDGETEVRSNLRGAQEVLNMGHAFNKMMTVLEERAASLDQQNARLSHEMEERKYAESQLEESEAQLRSVINNAVDGIITIDSKCCIRTFNSAAEKIFGYRASEVTKKNVSMLMPEPYANKHDSYVQNYIRTGKGQIIAVGPREVEGLRKDGSRFPLDLAISDVWNKEEPIFVGIIRDITERKQVEKELIEYRDHLQEMVDDQTHDLVEARDAALVAERAMSSFLANMSHELRTPLHGILSFAGFGMTKLNKVSTEKIYQYFSEISESGNHLLILLNDLLDLSKLRAGKMTYTFEKYDLEQVIYSVISEYEALLTDKNIQIIPEFSGEPVLVVIDKTRIAQVIRNILSNAIKFSQVDSVVKITIDQKDDNSVVVSITDQGVGIPAAELANIFDPFVQSSKTKTEAGGTGLGLAICKEIIEAGHRGWISALNSEYGGTTLEFCIPVTRL